MSYDTVSTSDDNDNNNMTPRLHHILSTKQFTVEMLRDLFLLTRAMEKADEAGNIPQALKGKIVANVFYEPSTRTRFSFEAAAQKLGGATISSESASHFSSAIKGESLPDSIRVISGYADAIVLRHPDKGSAELAASVSSVPIINAGDGAGEHPTQALLDLYTIEKEIGHIEGLRIAVLGDLLFGRTVHSLLNILSLYKGVRAHLFSPLALRLPEENKAYLARRGLRVEEYEKMPDALGDIDVLYVTRIQQERFVSKEEYEKLKNTYVVDAGTLQKLHARAIVMHPLPRVTEIAPEVDRDPRAAYFRQAKNGLHIRMALLSTLLTPRPIR